MVGARFPPALTDAVDAWAAKEGGISRADAIRRLVELGLKGKGKR
jgi:metal-responsive CopG/Arc/MetJ family transcriptional regulator